MIIPGNENLAWRFEGADGIDIDVTVNADTPEEIEAQTDEIEASNEVATAAPEAELDDAAVATSEEMYATIELHRAYLLRYGYDERFEMLANFDGRYNQEKARAGVESLDHIGSPHSALTQIALEGIGDFLKKVWEKIKKICKKVINWVSGIFTKVSLSMGSLESRLGKLSKLMKERVVDPDKLKDADGKVPSVKATAAAVDEFMKEAEPYVLKGNNELQDMIKELFSGKANATSGSEALYMESDNDKTSHYAADRAQTNQAGNAAADTKEDEISKEKKKELKKKYEKIKEIASGDKQEIKLKSMTESSMQEALSTAIEILHRRNKTKAAIDITQTIAKKLDEVADKYARMQGNTDGAARKSRKAAAKMIGNQTILGWELDAMSRVAVAALKVGSAFVTKCMKKDDNN